MLCLGFDKRDDDWQRECVSRTLVCLWKQEALVRSSVCSLGTQPCRPWHCLASVLLWRCSASEVSNTCRYCQWRPVHYKFALWKVPVWSPCWFTNVHRESQYVCMKSILSLCGVSWQSVTVVYALSLYWCRHIKLHITVLFSPYFQTHCYIYIL